VQPIIANCQDGVFAPDQTVEFPEGTWVKLWIVPEPEDADRLNDEDRAFLRELADRQKRVLEPLAE
jgi:predicted DNA-binding antitoxin AbrB/MazE fold protein